MDNPDEEKVVASRVHPHGLNSLLYRLSWRCPDWLFYYAHTFLVVGHGLRGSGSHPADYEIRLATEQDAESFASLRVAPEMVLSRLRSGDKCAIALREETIVSMLWAATGRLFEHESGMLIDTGDTGYYRYNSLTLVSERRKGLYLQCSLVLDRYYCEQRLRDAFGIIDIFNVVSLTASGKSGTTIEGEAIHWVVLGIHIVYYRRWPFRTNKLRIYIGKPSGDFRIL